MRKFEEKGNQAAALHIAVEIGDAGAVKRLLVDIIQYGNIDATAGYFANMTKCLLKAVPASPALGKRVLKLIDKLREIANALPQQGRKVPELNYFISAGKIAAVLGEIKDAERAVNGCLYEADFLGAAEIAVLMEREGLTEQAVSKHIEVTRDKFTLKSSVVGYIIATMANHHLQVAEKMWMMVAEKFFDAAPGVAYSVLKHLVS